MAQWTLSGNKRLCHWNVLHTVYSNLLYVNPAWKLPVIHVSTYIHCPTCTYKIYLHSQTLFAAPPDRPTRHSLPMAIPVSNTHRLLAPGSGQLHPPCHKQSHSGLHGSHCGTLSHQLQVDAHATCNSTGGSTDWPMAPYTCHTVPFSPTSARLKPSRCFRLTVADVSILQWPHVRYTMANHLIHWPIVIAEGFISAIGLSHILYKVWVEKIERNVFKHGTSGCCDE